MALLVFGLTALPGFGQSKEILIVTQPEGAAVVDQYGNELGKTGRPFLVNLSSYGSSLELTLNLDGYDSKLERISTEQLSRSARYPNEGAIVLQAKSPWAGVSRFLNQHPLALALGLLGLSAAGALGAIRRRKTRQQLSKGRLLEGLRSRAQELDDPIVGAKLGLYRILDRLGQGGAATVYRAVPDDDIEQGTAVAVKILDQGEYGREEFLERFRREVNVWKNLIHRNIVEFVDWNEQEGLTFLVLELVEGRTLRNEFNKGTRSTREALEILRPVFSAVVYAHQAGVSHRDLKPENILVGATGVPKVTDFGLARTGAEDKLTKTGTWMGTLSYMAPEQVRGFAVDPRSDQYALGVMLYELLSGKPPFQGGDQVKTMFALMTKKPPPLRKTRPELNEAFCDAVARMLEKKPEKRFPDLEQALQALEEALG